jgi:hypothetical protein
VDNNPYRTRVAFPSRPKFPYASFGMVEQPAGTGKREESTMPKTPMPGRPEKRSGQERKCWLLVAEVADACEGSMSEPGLWQVRKPF